MKKVAGEITSQTAKQANKICAHILASDKISDDGLQRDPWCGLEANVAPHSCAKVAKSEQARSAPESDEETQRKRYTYKHTSDNVPLRCGDNACVHSFTSMYVCEYALKCVFKHVSCWFWHTYVWALIQRSRKCRTVLHNIGAPSGAWLKITTISFCWCYCHCYLSCAGENSTGNGRNRYRRHACQFVWRFWAAKRK